MNSLDETESRKFTEHNDEFYELVAGIEQWKEGNRVMKMKNDENATHATLDATEKLPARARVVEEHLCESGDERDVSCEDFMKLRARIITRLKRHASKESYEMLNPVRGIFYMMGASSAYTNADKSRLRDDYIDFVEDAHEPVELLYLMLELKVKIAAINKDKGLSTGKLLKEVRKNIESITSAFPETVDEIGVHVMDKIDRDQIDKLLGAQITEEVKTMRKLLEFSDDESIEQAVSMRLSP